MQTDSKLNVEPTNSNGRNKKRRVALTPHKGEIEAWVAQGKSDAWIASALGTSPSSVQSFRSRHDICRNSGRQAAEASGGEDSGEQDQSLYEGVLEHGGETGYGLWLDPAVADDPLFKQGFSGVSDINVKLEKERIVLTPAAISGAAGTGSVSAEELQSLKPGLTDFERAAPRPPLIERTDGSSFSMERRDSASSFARTAKRSSFIEPS